MFNNDQLLLVLVVTLCAVYVLSQNGSSGSSGSQSEVNKLFQKVKALAEKKSAEGSKQATDILNTIQKLSEKRDNETAGYISELNALEIKLNSLSGLLG